MTKTRITAKDIRTATKVEVSDGHPANSGGETYIYLKIEGLWYEAGDTNEDGITDAQQIRCHDILRAWKGDEPVIDQYDALIAKWESE